MYGHNPYGGGGYGPSCASPCHNRNRGCGQRKGSYGGSTFVLIVVLFILLIIVGCSFV